MQKEIQGVSKKVTVSAEEKQEENRESTVSPVRSATGSQGPRGPEEARGRGGQPQPSRKATRAHSPRTFKNIYRLWLAKSTSRNRSQGSRKNC